MHVPTPPERATRGPWPRLLRALLHPHACVALLIAATLFARASALDTPIGRVRATLTAMITRNLSRDLPVIGPRAVLYPRVDYAGDQPGYLVQEFPLVNLIGVAFEKGLGLAWEPAYRLPSLLLYAVMLGYLYAFARRRFGSAEALAACFVASYLPLSVYASLEVMPEQGVAAAFVAGLYYFDRHLDRGERRPLVLAAIACALMLLVKSTSGLLFLLLVGLFQLRRGTLRGLFAPRYLTAAALAGLPLVLWLVHATPVNRASLVDDGRSMAELIDNYLEQKERWTQLGKGKTYAGMWRMLVEAYTTSGMVLFLAGAGAALIGLVRARALVAWGLASLLAFMAFLPFNTATHWYYTHGYVPLLALSGGLFLAGLVRAGRTLLSERAGRVLAGAAALGGLVFVLRLNWDFAPPYERPRHEFGLVLQELFEPRTLGILSSEDTGPWDGETIWAGDVRAWRASVRKGLSRRPLSEEFIEERRARGARFLAHLGPRESLAARIPAWVERQEAAGKLLASAPGWSVFSLE
jgi:hypothetical protein